MIDKEHLTILKEGLVENKLYVIRDIDSPILSELKNFNIFRPLGAETF